MGKRIIKRHIRYYRIYLSVTFLALLGWTYKISISLLGGTDIQLQNVLEAQEGIRRRNQDVSDGSLTYEVHQYPKDLFSDGALFSGAHLLHFFGMIYMFLGLTIVCDEFFVPALEVIV
jgi:hypothetical protein